MDSTVVSRPSSELCFRSPDGQRCELVEWRALLLEVSEPWDGWESWSVSINGERRPFMRRFLGGQVRCVSEWPRSEAGFFQVLIERPGLESEEHRLRVPPSKLGPQALERLLDDLERRLPHALAVALTAGGARAGLLLRPPGEVTREAELARLQRAVEGGDAGAGLVVLLRRIARRPLRALVETEVLVPQAQVRRPHARLLREAQYRQRQVDDQGKPLVLGDRRVESSYDLPENRLLRLLVATVLRRLRCACRCWWTTAQQKLAHRLIDELERAARTTPWLDSVGEAKTPPIRLTHAMIHRTDYRRLPDIWRQVTAAMEVRLEAAALETQLQSVPALYELWGSLIVLETVTRLLVDRGFKVICDRVLHKLPDGPVVKLARGQGAVTNWRHPDGTQVDIYFQRGFSRWGDLVSVSYEQRPDVSVAIRSRDGTMSLLIFDAKYKIDGSRARGVSPAKESIDKMHAYRDAIVDRSSARVVRHAAILYPGPTERYGRGVSALCADPLASDQLEVEVSSLVEEALFS